MAERTLTAAALTLEMLLSDGWPSLLGPSTPGERGDRLGRSAVAERARGEGSGAALIDRFF